MKQLIIPLILVFVLISCDKNIKDNPYDEDVEIDWSPTNVNAETIGPYVVKIKWNITKTLIDGFIIDRKEENGNWENNFSIEIGSNENTWTDYQGKANTNYTYRIYAIAGKNSSDSKLVSIKTPKGNTTGTFVDSRDNNEYKWVKIGNQTWMAENLAYIPYVNPCLEDGNSTEDGIWVGTYDGTNISEAKNTEYYQNYGCLYQYVTAYNLITHKDICPTGWHLPTNDEWEELFDYLGGREIAGGKLKEAGGSFTTNPSSRWNNGSENSTNESGFTALPSGSRSSSGIYATGWYGPYWSRGPASANIQIFYDQQDNIEFKSAGYFDYGVCIRCIKNNN